MPVMFVFGFTFICLHKTLYKLLKNDDERVHATLFENTHLSSVYLLMQNRKEQNIYLLTQVTLVNHEYTKYNVQSCALLN